VTSLDLGEQLAGSAAYATAWLFVEQPRRWQHDAADSPHPDHPEAMRRLVARAGDLDVRLQLLRRQSDDRDEPWRPLVVLVTGGRAVQARLAPDQLDPLADGGTLEALAGGELPAGWTPVQRLWAVCTHGRRDACCALRGRTLAAALEEADPGLVWETTHTGGHRLAPNVVVLPDGLVYGRVTPGRAVELVAAQRAGRVVPDLLRGRADLRPPAQVAEVALRTHLTLDDSGAVAHLSTGPAEVDAAEPSVTRTPSSWQAQGREWRVVVDTFAAAPRPVSCGADPTRPLRHTVVEVTDVEAAGRGAAGWDADHREADVPSADDADHRVLDAVAATPPGRALDLACGTGRHALALARLGWSVHAVDFSRAGLAALSRAAVDADVTTELADARIWHPDGDTFDLVLLSFVHVPGVLERAATWLRPGGRLVVVGHAVRNLTEGVGGPSDVRLLHDPDTLVSDAEAAHLTVERCEEVRRQTTEGTALDVVLVAVSPAAE
jgi:protein-L-isoaspartate O-methyltransferase/(2Fe-2S) ferredoxin